MLEPLELVTLFDRCFGGPPESVVPVRAHGSSRRIYRLAGAGRAVIGAVHDDRAENAAFVAMSRHFRALALPVPEIFGVSDDDGAYLEEDLGDTTLFELLQAGRAGADDPTGVSEAAAGVYARAVSLLPEFQVRAAREFDFTVCYPRAAFDAQSMRWDLNYFKYHFLKLAQVPFDEQALEDDFGRLIGYLQQASSDHFLYRDFQSRNIMVRADGDPWFIDYQGGRRGALQYDLASLLVDAKANLPLDFRGRLIEVYLNALEAHLPVDRAAFLGFLDGFTLIRILQAMGAYGFRGFYERKTHFLQSVPYAIGNIEVLLGAWRLPVALPALVDALQRIARSTRLRELVQAPTAGRVPLTVEVCSFSYKRGLPVDASGHGGGFVFDCRSLPNPGREVRFSKLAGDESETVAWLEAHDEVHAFVGRVREMIEPVIAAYQRRGFTHLSVAFGCTGGQHRSVYCATQLARHLATRAGVQVHLGHRDVVRAGSSGGQEGAAS